VVPAVKAAVLELQRLSQIPRDAVITLAMLGDKTHIRPGSGAPSSALRRTRLLRLTGADGWRSIKVFTLPVLECDLLVWTKLTHTQNSALACALISTRHWTVLPRTSPPSEHRQPTPSTYHRVPFSRCSFSAYLHNLSKWRPGETIEKSNSERRDTKITIYLWTISCQLIVTVIFFSNEASKFLKLIRN